MLPGKRGTGKSILESQLSKSQIPSTMLPLAIPPLNNGLEGQEAFSLLIPSVISISIV